MSVISALVKKIIELAFKDGFILLLSILLNLERCTLQNID